ncbi:pentatricopeptide repeat-containing protein At1g62680, mitochondrial-like [Prosopis cineraria]|uniref:pentatricopeptide repeat-containing protein At1g62680, mitochondrial-like n=1 Tax=Prosopis cineraria TaxID=364024 RepID=UPI00240F4E2B|nr:pentatricopeptide repeat-containing protein At1g62680, mitochondrial-like [Prosopis cineraria]
MFCGASRYAFPKFPFFPASSPSSFLPSPSYALPLYFCLHSNSTNPLRIEELVSSFHALLHRHPRPCIVQINKALVSIARMKHHPTAISLFALAESKGFTPSFVTLGVLINCYCHVGQMTFAFSVFGKILKMGCQPNTIILTTLMKGLCINDDVGKALDFYDDLIVKGFNLNEEGLITEASDLFHEMIGHVVSPNAMTYTSMINGLCCMDKWPEAAKLFSQMRLESINPDIYTFNVLVDAFCKEGSVTKAEAVVGMMMKHGINPM